MPKSERLEERKKHSSTGSFPLLFFSQYVEGSRDLVLCRGRFSFPSANDTCFKSQECFFSPLSFFQEKGMKRGLPLFFPSPSFLPR